MWLHAHIQQLVQVVAHRLALVTVPFCHNREMNHTIDPEGNSFECLIRYEFKTRGELHDVQLEHKWGDLADFI